MGRLTMAAERTEQILDAFSRCVIRLGVAGTTLEDVAKEAGLARGHVRHYVGNRDMLLNLFRDRMVLRYVTHAQQIISGAPAGEKARSMMLDLFAPGWERDPYAQAVEAVLESARLDAGIREQVYAVYAAMESTLAQALEADYPDRPAVLYLDTAYQLLALMYGHWSLVSFGFPENRRLRTVQRALDIIESVGAVGVGGQS